MIFDLFGRENIKQVFIILLISEIQRIDPPRRTYIVRRAWEELMTKKQGQHGEACIIGDVKYKSRPCSSFKNNAILISPSFGVSRGFEVGGYPCIGLSRRFEVRSKILLAFMSLNSVHFPLKIIWRFKMPPRVAFFSWSAALGRIFTTDINFMEEMYQHD